MLRIKILLILSTIVVGVALLASTIIYKRACHELGKAAERRLKEDVTAAGRIGPTSFRR